MSPHGRAVQVLFAAVLLAPATTPVRAQGGGTADSILARVQRLAGDGKAAAARALADSALGAAKEGSPAFVEALFARAGVAVSADAARRDYLRIALEYSASPRAEASFLRLAQLELARGDRAAAKAYLDRLALEYPAGATRAQGAYWLGRVLLDEGTLLPACASLAEARAHAATTDVELLNQIDYYSRPCAAARRAADSVRADSIDKVVKAARADSIARAAAAAKAAAAARRKAAKEAEKREPVKRTPGRTATPAAKGAIWSVQVAAYEARENAQRLAKKLTDRGFDARVTNEKPFRVRIGRYAGRSDALEVVAKLKDANMTAIVVEAEKP